MSGSTTSLPSYVAPSLTNVPTYSAEPQAYEQRLAWVARNGLGVDFVKQSKNGGLGLRLKGQEENAALPVYGYGAVISGRVEIADSKKGDGLVAVEIKIEGSLHLKEIAGGGTTTHKLCLSRSTLWNNSQSRPCPSSLPFSIELPSHFDYSGESYPLPPTHEAQLKGVPGFRAIIDYSVTAHIQKTGQLMSRVPLKNGNTVSTPFIYYPRSRPAVPVPSPMLSQPLSPGFADSTEWKCFESVMSAKNRRNNDILAKLWIPASRVFHMREPIPFHLSFVSSAQSLTAFLPWAPSTSSISPKRPTRLQLLRQVSVDVRNPMFDDGSKTDIWNVFSIGEATFRHTADGADFTSFSGEIRVDDNVKNGAFRAGGLFVKDCLVLSIHAPDPAKCPFADLRLVVPVRLATDSWDTEGRVHVPSSPSEEAVGQQRFGEYSEQ
ncbi:hypothetical protein BXZ70DRAFT_1002312 [Cristinia sonorae]|uniref:Uncharacterized protein n=1 Tax=Cristinia sonorae TaxID=1940300 RepID=A0A8K0UFE2_9AGAR|nr:hypothetical protein BXZ70DRAFT_1002312 [Cristinia sonorae]